MTRAGKLGLLSALYFAQGLPFGFQATALPVYLREAGVSLTMIGLASALGLPWMLKALWAPLVDKYGSEKFGRRKSWIVPAQLGLLLCTGAAALIPPEGGLGWLVGLVFLMNVFASTQDIAVDGLAVDLLADRDLGFGNAAQVVGYKIGMLTGGGLLVWASGWLGPSGMFAVMAGLLAAVLALSLAFTEPPDPARQARIARPMQELLRTLYASLTGPGARWVLLFVGTYKLGETMADAMFKPLLVDAGFSAAAVGKLVGTYGMAFSVIGSLLGGLLATRVPFHRAVGITAALRIGPIIGEWWLSVTTPTEQAVLLVTSAEHLFGGMLTPCMFAFMMSRVDRRVGASHFTVLASVELFGKLPAAWLSGLLADTWGYPLVFMLAVLGSVAFLGLLWPISRLEATR